MITPDATVPDHSHEPPAVRLAPDQLEAVAGGAGDQSMPPNFVLTAHSGGFSVKAPWGERFFFVTEQAALDWAWANA